MGDGCRRQLCIQNCYQSAADRDMVIVDCFTAINISLETSLHDERIIYIREISSLYIFNNFVFNINISAKCKKLTDYWPADGTAKADVVICVLQHGGDLAGDKLIAVGAFDAEQRLIVGRAVQAAFVQIEPLGRQRTVTF